VDDMDDLTDLTPGYLRLSIIPLRGPEDLKEAFASIEREKPRALVVPASGSLYTLGREFARKAVVQIGQVFEVVINLKTAKLRRMSPDA
jgi:hypothetical protein